MRTLQIPLMLFLAVALGIAPVRAGRAAMTLNKPGLRTLRSDGSGVVLELSTSFYEISKEDTAARPFQTLKVPGFELTGEPGKPQVPVVNALIGVPPDAQVELFVLIDDSRLLPGPYILTPAPSPVALGLELQPGEQIHQIEKETYQSERPYPAVPVRIADEAWFRDQRLVRVELFPFQYRPLSGELLWHQHLRVEVRFNREQPKDLDKVSATVQNTPFEPILAQMLLNYEEARAWRSLKAAFTGSAETHLTSFDSSQTTYKITVDHDGMYRLTYNDLQAAGVPVDTVDPQGFRLTSQGRNIAIHVAGEGDHSFDQGDSLTFYGQKFRGDQLAEDYLEVLDDWIAPWIQCPDCKLPEMLEQYTDKNVYWLTVENTPGQLRMDTADGSPGIAPVPDHYTATQRAEQELIYWGYHFTSADSWLWAGIFNTQPQAYTITLSSLATGVHTATIRGEVVPFVNTTHQAQVWINDQGQPFDEPQWTGLERNQFIGQVPQTILNDGANLLNYQQLNSPDIIYFDGFEIEYARQFQAMNDQLIFQGVGEGTWKYQIDNLLSGLVEVYDLIDPLSPTRVLNPVTTNAGATYQTSFEVNHGPQTQYVVVGETGFQQPLQIESYNPQDFSARSGVDYVYITHPDFLTAVQPLAAYHAALGMTTLVVDINDLYHHFNHGIYHPIAIRNFLAYAFENWSSPPRYVLLVGDGHYNFKGYNPDRYGTDPIFMPPNMALVDPWAGEVDSTNLLATVVGDDILPDLAIGRLPVRSVGELASVIEKIMTYGGIGLKDHGWQHNIAFIADNVPDPKHAGDFVTLSEDIISDFLNSSEWNPVRLYQNNFGCEAGDPAACEQVTEAITGTLNITGTWLVNYSGHGDIEHWSHEEIFINEHVAALTNADQLPVVLSMTCLDGYWFHPFRENLASELLREDAGGAVSTFSPTGLGVATGHDRLQRGFYQALFVNDIRDLGLAALAGKLHLYASGYNYDLLHTFTVFGDPALKIAKPPNRYYIPYSTK